MKLSKKIFLVLFCTICIFSSFGQEKKLRIKEGAILHCWCWSFNTIRENMEKIAEAGFTALQTSPANTCLVGEGGGMDLMGNGKWYYHYQPIDWKIGNYQLGTRDDFIAMCAEAEKYGINVIVDVLPNHTTPMTTAIKQEFIDAVGGWDNLYHENGRTRIVNYSNRYDCTTGEMGGLPDVNTENPLFQEYFMDYINDLIECGADGFRYDTAKHIGLPDDPKDAKSPENDFWPIFTGRKAINGKTVKDVENLFIYGEVLQGDNSREGAYSEYIYVTASTYGYTLRRGLENSKLLVRNITDWKNEAGGENLVTWVESHDTYANAGESAKMTNFQLRAGYAVITARKDGTPLFFNRPQGPESTQFPGVSKIGDMGNDQFMHPEVTAVNYFRQAMKGEDEEILNGSDSGVLIIKRGDKGIVIINTNGKTEKIEMEVNWPDGKYFDKANNIKFTVKNGILKGKIKKEKIAVIY